MSAAIPGGFESDRFSTDISPEAFCNGSISHHQYSRVHDRLGRGDLRFDSSLGGRRKVAEHRPAHANRRSRAVALDDSAVDLSRMDKLHDGQEPRQAWRL